MIEDFPRQLIDARESLRVSVREVSEETRIPAHFIDSFESWDFSHIGALVYARGFFEKYISFLGLSREPALNAFEARWIESFSGAPSPEAQEAKRMYSVFGERTRVLVGGALAIILVVAYLGYSLKNTVLAPAIEIRHPEHDMATDVPAIDIEGRVVPETSLSVSGRPIYVDEHGNFKERMYLASGVNVLEFEAKNKFGKETKITRYILLK